MRQVLRKEKKIRVALDGNIRATEFSTELFGEQLCMYPVFDPFNLILEVKYDGFLLSYIRELLNTADKSEMAASKCCLARSICMGYQFYSSSSLQPTVCARSPLVSPSDLL